MVESVDTRGLKLRGGNPVRVRVPPPAFEPFWERAVPMLRVSWAGPAASFRDRGWRRASWASPTRPYAALAIVWTKQVGTRLRNGYPQNSCAEGVRSGRGKGPSLCESFDDVSPRTTVS